MRVLKRLLLLWLRVNRDRRFGSRTRVNVMIRIGDGRSRVGVRVRVRIRVRVWGRWDC